MLVGLLVEHIALPANFALQSDLAAAEERCYPDETFYPLLRFSKSLRSGYTQDNLALKRTINVHGKCRLT